jgi:AcrR family transcriptional regulator
MKETKELILRTAKKLFGKKGITDTTMDDVAKEARIGKGTIYHYFESKEQVYCIIIEEEMDVIKKELLGIISAESSPDKKLLAYILGRMRLMAKFPNFYSMFKKDYIDYFGYIRKSYEKYREFEMDSVKKCLKEGSDAAVFAVDDIDFTAFTIVEMIKGLEYHLASEKDEEVVRKVNIVMNIILNGIEKK